MKFGRFFLVKRFFRAIPLEKKEKIREGEKKKAMFNLKDDNLSESNLNFFLHFKRPVLFSGQKNRGGEEGGEKERKDF